MTAYRGIEKEKLIESLQAAEAFLRQCGLGPATTRALDEWRAGNPYESLARAGDDQTLAAVMSATRTSFLLPRFHDVFAHHARRAFQAGSPAQGLYRDLSAWDAFEGGKSYEEIAAEISVHVIVDSLKALHEAGGQIKIPAKNPIPVMGSDDGHDNSGIDEWLEMAVPLLNDMAGGDPAFIGAFLQGASPEYKLTLKNMLYAQTRLDRMDAALDTPHALRRFAIIPAGARPVPTDTEEKLAQFLSPYRRTHEVDLGSVRLMGDGIVNMGVAFRATARVAREVAAAFETYNGYQVRDLQDRGSGFSP